MSTTDANGGIHDGLGKFAGRVQNETDPDRLLPTEVRRPAPSEFTDTFTVGDRVVTADLEIGEVVEFDAENDVVAVRMPGGSVRYRRASPRSFARTD